MNKIYSKTKVIVDRFFLLIKFHQDLFETMLFELVVCQMSFPYLEKALTVQYHIKYNINI